MTTTRLAPIFGLLEFRKKSAVFNHKSDERLSCVWVNSYLDRILCGWPISFESAQAKQNTK